MTKPTLTPAKIAFMLPPCQDFSLAGRSNRIAVEQTAITPAQGGLIAAALSSGTE